MIYPLFPGLRQNAYSGVISEFRKLYIKTGIFDVSISSVISELFNLRTGCDYDDFYVISKAAVFQHLENAEALVNTLGEHLKTR